MSCDIMDWTPATPPQPFDPYGENYMPGGWTLTPPPPTEGVFARRPDPGFFVPAAKKVCGGLALFTTTVFAFTCAQAANAAIRANNFARRRRIAHRAAHPLPPLKDSPWTRAIAAQRAVGIYRGPIQSYDIVRTSPNPFNTSLQQITNPPTGVEAPISSTDSVQQFTKTVIAAEAPYLFGTPLSDITEIRKDLPPTAQAPPPLQSCLSTFKRPRKQVHFTSDSDFQPREMSTLYVGMPTFDPPKEATPRVVSPRPKVDTPPSCGNVYLYKAEPFPNMRPAGSAKMQKKQNIPTPPLDSPSTQLMADLVNPEYQSNDGNTSDVSSDMSDSWVPIGKAKPKKNRSSREKKRVTIMENGSPVSNKTAQLLNDEEMLKVAVPVGAPITAPETLEHHPKATKIQDEEMLQIAVPVWGSVTPSDTPKHQPETINIDTSKSDISSTVPYSPSDGKMVLSKNGTPVMAQTSTSASVVATPGSDISSTVPYSPSDGKWVLSANGTLTKATTPTPERVVATPESDISSTVPYSPRDGNWILSENGSPILAKTPTSTSLRVAAILNHHKTPSPDRRKRSLPNDNTTPETDLLNEVPSPFSKLSLYSRPVTLERKSDSSPKADLHSGEKTVRTTRAQKAKAKWEDQNKNFEKLAPLDADWEARVEDAVRSGIDRLRLSASDLARVVPLGKIQGTANWLNDETINAYLDVIVAHGKAKDREGQTPSYHAFNSFFYNKLVKDGPNGVKRWASRGKIGGKNLLQTKQVFIPIHSGAHWTLAVVSGENNTITYYDSLGGMGAAKLNDIKGWVKNELGSAWSEKEWTILSGESPQQANSDDCGVFAITSARQIMLGCTPISYGPEDIEVQRKRIVAELVNGGLLKA